MEKRNVRKSMLRILIAGSLLVPAIPVPIGLAATLDVSDYGADGADSLDDAAGINAAIQAAGPGDTVYLPAGTYHIASTIVGKSGVTLQGEDRDTTVVRFTGTTEMPMIRLSGTDGAKIVGLTLDGNDSPYVTRGIVGEPAHRAVVRDIRMTDLAMSTGFGPFGVLFSGSEGVQVTDSDFEKIGTASQWGGAIRVGWNSKDPTITDNTIQDTGRGGIFLNDGVTGGVVSRNAVSGSGWTSNSLGLSIELYTNVTHSLVEDNVVDHWISVAVADYNAVRRNTVRATDGTYKSYGLEISSGNSIVSDNWVDGGQHLGISSSPGKDYTLFAYNRIEDMIQWGMQLQATSPAAANNHHYFYKNEFLNTDKDNPIARYPDHAGFGVRLHGHSTNITFDSNTIGGNDRYAINITDTLPGIDRISFVNNEITNNGLSTIDYYPPEAQHLEWSGNTVTGNGTDLQLESRGFPNQKPVADFTAPSAALVGQAVTFVNTSTDADGAIAHSLWDFGEGLPSTSTSPTYFYKKPGTYRVMLMATDSDGRSSVKEHTIVVSQGAPDTEAPLAPTGLAATMKTDTTVTLAWNAAVDNYGAARYEVYRDGVFLAATNGPETTFTVTNLQASTAYAFAVKAIDAAGNVSPLGATLSVTTERAPGGGAGTIVREYWNNVTGTDIFAIPFHLAPTGTQVLTRLETAQNIGDNFGARIRGYVTPSVTGNYTFYIASDNKSELWLGSDDNPATKTKIASVDDWTNPREWTKFPSQKSAAVHLIAGQSYYVEVLQKEAGGGDNLSVGWTGPGISTITVIDGGYLSPFDGSGSDTASPSAPTQLAATEVASDSIRLSWTAATDNVGVAAYDIYKDGVPAGSVSGSATSFLVGGLLHSTTHSFFVRAKDAAGNVSAASNTQSVATAADPNGGVGTVIREYWTGLSGNDLATVPFHTVPKGTQALASLEAPTNWGDAYGARIRGYITPSVTGDYTFYVASDDRSELWLSADENPANKVKIGSVADWTNVREWTKSPSQKSPVLSLTAGQSYYVEVLHKEGHSGDHLAVGWSGPAISGISVVAGAYLSVEPVDGIAPTATFYYSVTGPTNGDVVATLLPSEPVTVLNNGGSSSYTFTENGSFTFEFVDEAGNAGSATATVTSIDKVAPTLTVIVDKPVLAQNDHELVDVQLSWIADDVGSGVESVRLVSVTSDEPDNGPGDGNTTGDIQGADLGTADTRIQLRAERAGGGDGRTYTITFEATDGAGNVALATATVVVPHDNGN